MKKFDITCTATLRPELLSVTLKSHYENLFRNNDNIRNARFIINIDKTGAKRNQHESKVYDILKIIEQYNFYDIVFRIGHKPHFPTAFIWCMEQLENKLVFHLEEDWQLVQHINFNNMLEMFDKYKSLVHLRLSAFNSGGYQCKNWNRFLNWNGDFFEVKQEEKGTIGWCGHPSLNRVSFIKDCLEFIDISKNPEKQIKGRKYSHPINSIINMSRFGCYHKPNTLKAEIDIGRKWMVENNWAKSGNKAWFTNWEKIK